MKNNWRRGILLGVSLALLLGSSVALANGLFLVREKPCVVCRSGPAKATEDQLQRFTLGGWNPQYGLCLRTTIDGVLHSDICFVGMPPSDPYSPEAESFPCEWGAVPVDFSVLGEEVSVAVNGAPDPLGVWVYRLYQRDGQGQVLDWDEASWLVARVCEEEEEFVPEPGSILLLGSGLAGLAGYATLRWRARE